MARAQTYSNYKSHNTVKFLIGICPQGVISYISQGRKNIDKYLTENCGILDNLLPGDLILADRGFNVQESVGLFCATIKVPPFTRGKKQLSSCDVDRARQLSRVRIDIERVIGAVRQKFSILSSTVSIFMIRREEGSNTSLLDKLVVVCCALNNCCDSIINLS